jgi:hypothetical protein
MILRGAALVAKNISKIKMANALRARKVMSMIFSQKDSKPTLQAILLWSSF